MILLPYGVRQGELVHVSEVLSGAACDCQCPACEAPLIAKRGARNRHHFAHASGVDCASAVETALHLAAKEILQQSREIVLPAVDVHFKSHRTMRLAPEQRYAMDRAELERRVGSVVPDVLAFIQGRPIAIEIRVTHAVDASKAASYSRRRLSAIEIDLSAHARDFAIPNLTPLVVGAGPHKRWVYNAAAEARRREILATGKKLKAVERAVYDCPLRKRVWNGRACAHVINDCLYCEHALEIGSNMETVICAASGPNPPGHAALDRE